MKKPTSIAALTYVQRKDWERARLKEISLKWAKIARAHAKEDFPSAEINPSSGYEFDGAYRRIPLPCAWTSSHATSNWHCHEWHFAQTGYAERASGSNGR